MTTAQRRQQRRRRGRSSSSDSTDEVLSSDDEPVGPSTSTKAAELTLKDDEDTIAFQAPLPDDEGKRSGWTVAP